MVSVSHPSANYPPLTLRAFLLFFITNIGEGVKNGNLRYYTYKRRPGKYHRITDDLACAANDSDASVAKK